MHRAQEAAEILSDEKIECEIIDLRSVVPLDEETICDSVKKTGHLLVVDEDYLRFGLTGEIAAICLEQGLQFKYDRVATETTIPYDHQRELETLPNRERICTAVRILAGTKGVK